MNDLFKSRIFIAVFLTAYFSFSLITTGLLDFQSAAGFAGHSSHGFPFAYYNSHCFGGHYLWPGLLGNILFAAFLGLLAGLFSAYLYRNRLLPPGRKITPDDFREKWRLS